MFSKKLTFIIGWSFVLLVFGVVWSSVSPSRVSAGFTPTPEPPPVPTQPPPPPPPTEDDNDRDDPCKQGAIIGTVMDLCAGQPGGGIQMSINGAIVTTDGAGHYSITGLTPGQYDVALQLPGGQTPAQASVSVNLGCGESVTVDPNYYSCQLLAPTLVPPPDLPETGRVNWAAGVMSLLLIGLGVGVIRLAVWLRRQW